MEKTPNKERPGVEANRAGRGGKRPGAGRKPNYLKRLGIKAITAAEILAHHNEPELWAGLLRHKSPDIRLRTIQYLTDRRDGKPKQAVAVSGGILHAHTAYRDPLLAGLSDEELQALNSLSRKLALPSPDGPHNQIESDTAIVAEEVDSDPSEASTEVSQDGQFEPRTPQETSA
jgi:hypothetical protein